MLPIFAQNLTLYGEVCPLIVSQVTGIHRDQTQLVISYLPRYDSIIDRKVTLKLSSLSQHQSMFTPVVSGQHL